MPTVWRAIIALMLSTSVYAFAEEAEERAWQTPDTGQMSETGEMVDVYAVLSADWPWRYEAPLEAAPDLQHRAAPLDGIEFVDYSMLERLSGLKALSILTLGRFGDTTLILGVNSEGVLGVHFDTGLDEDGEDIAELARMPYLHDAQPEAPHDDEAGGEHPR